MVLSFPHQNRYWLEPGQSWEYFWIGLQGPEALRVLRAVLDSVGPVLRPSREIVDRMADACLSLATRDLPVGDASASAYAAAMAIHDAAFGGRLPDNVEHPLPVRRAEAAIEEDLTANLSVDRLARIAGISRAHFVRLFSKSVGASPSAYVWQRRMELAERLLLATDASVETIAHTCGFSDGNYFAKAFRRAHGTTPTAFRSARLKRVVR